MTFRPSSICKNPNCRTYSTPSAQKFRHDESRGDITCINCGRVAEEKTQHQTEEKLTFAESDVNKSRTQAVNEYIGDLSTTVAENRNADPSLARRTKAQDPKTKALLQAKKSIAEFSEKLGIPAMICDKARSIFKAYLEHGTRKPKKANSDSMILAILYMALKEEGYARDFPDLASVSSDEGDKAALIRKCYSTLKKALPTREYGIGTTAADLVGRFCSTLNFPEALRSVAMDVAKKASPELEGKFPASVAGASILYTLEHAGLPANIQDIAQAANLKPSTIKNAFSGIQGLNPKDMLPDDFDDLVRFAKSKSNMK